MRLHFMAVPRLALVMFAACASSEDIALRAPSRATEPKPVVAAARVTAQAPTPDTPPSCITDSKPFDTKTLGDRIAFLASDDLGGRVPGSDGDLAARTFIRDRFACLGLTPAGDSK